MQEYDWEIRTVFGEYSEVEELTISWGGEELYKFKEDLFEESEPDHELNEAAFTTIIDGLIDFNWSWANIKKEKWG